VEKQMLQIDEPEVHESPLCEDLSMRQAPMDQARIDSAPDSRHRLPLLVTMEALLGVAAIVVLVVMTVAIGPRVY
jgi:hypothetical protein